MQLNDLKPTWKQYKFINSLQPLASEDIILMIDQVESTDQFKISRLILNISMFIIMAIIIQGG